MKMRDIERQKEISVLEKNKNKKKIKKERKGMRRNDIQKGKRRRRRGIENREEGLTMEQNDDDNERTNEH